MNHEVNAWSEAVTLPTYEVGCIDPNPLFLENRVYQGSSGSVYPYGVIDSISDIKQDKIYQGVYLENEYLKVMLLPELGGRIHRAYDKVNQRDFVYYNEVVKPALVGLLGPWISGGIEFNWPQHHRPTTFMPVDYKIERHSNGAVTVWMGEIESMYGLQIMAGFKLYPNRALIEITGKVYNGNETPRSFLWWSNPAVKGGDDHQSIFPPDVTAVYDHGKRDVSDFPIATGEYYKVDYSPGTDISRYKNLPVPTSYMADKSCYDFVGAYSHNEQGGLLHIANHHISPGKKQWTWGNCDFGQAWDRNLTDSNGPYIELMTGVYTDNQPDFTWLDSQEEKSFVQNFLPYADLGRIHNANTDLALKLERDEQQQQVTWGVYAIAPLTGCRVVVGHQQAILVDETINLMPAHSLIKQLKYQGSELLTMTVVSADGFRTLSYTEHVSSHEPIPEPAREPPLPAATDSVDELFFIGQHLEQYHHATRDPEAYYLEGIKRDPQHYQCNLAMAYRCFNAANFNQALMYANHALNRAHQYNNNPICGKASYIRGCVYERLGQLDSAYADFFKSTWSGNCRDVGYAAAARIALKQHRLEEALDCVQRALQFNGRNYLAAITQAVILTKLNRQETALAWIDQQLLVQPLGYALSFQRYRISRLDADRAKCLLLLNDRDVNLIRLLNVYLSLGETEAAQEVLQLNSGQGAMVRYYQAYLNGQSGCLDEAIEYSFNQHVLFPNTLTEVTVLQRFSLDYFAQYLLGCFFYAKRQYETAVMHWEMSLKFNPDFPQAYRNLAIYQFNKQHAPHKARVLMSQAFERSPEDARILFELDYIKRVLGDSPQQRLAFLQAHQQVMLKRDDLVAEYLNLLNVCGELSVCHAILSHRIFHPWEGGEGKITGQYVINQIRMALKQMVQHEFMAAVETLNQALHYPGNLGEGHLVVQTDNDIHCLLGFCYRYAHNESLANYHFGLATGGKQEIGESKYYNDLPADYVLYQALAWFACGDAVRAQQLLNEMIRWGDENQTHPVQPDFFAVSLPELVVFDKDLNQQHRLHCLFVKGIAQAGLELIMGNDTHHSAGTLNTLLAVQPEHAKAHLCLEVIRVLRQLMLNGESASVISLHHDESSLK